MSSPHDTAGGQAAQDQRLAQSLESMVRHPDYPCLGAKSVFNRDRAVVRVFEELGTEASAEGLLTGLRDFAAGTDVADGFASFVAVFRNPARGTGGEAEFERLLWRQLQLLHRADDQPWSPLVSDDPASPHFAFSVAGTAYFVVGLHPGASRRARRAELPTMVFNLHEQFERLRESNQFERMRDTIRRRDALFQGDVNPMVNDYGQVSEARQYAGRAVPEGWSAPFEPRGKVELG